jgi:hypothetical protein
LSQNGTENFPKTSSSSKHIIMVNKHQNRSKIVPNRLLIFHFAIKKQTTSITIETNKIKTQYVIPPPFIFTIEFELMNTVEKNHGKPIQKSKSNILLPIEFDMTISADPFFTKITVKISSGKLVPNAITVRPATLSGIRAVYAFIHGKKIKK